MSFKVAAAGTPGTRPGEASTKIIEGYIKLARYSLDGNKGDAS